MRIWNGGVEAAGDGATTAWDFPATPHELRRLLENASDLITVVDSGGTITYSSPSTQRLLGYAAGEVLGRSISDFLDASDRGGLRALLGEALLDPGHNARIEFRFRHRDGRWRTLEGVVSRLGSEGPDPSLVISARDVTDARLAERRQVDTEQHYRALFDLNPMPMWLYDRATLRFL